METEKTARLLYLYRDFARGAKVRKQEAADRFGVTQRSLQRDIEDLRCFFAEQTPPGEIIYDAKERAYRLVERGSTLFTNGEVLAVCKILLESRSLRRDEMLPVLDKLVSCCVPAEQRQAVAELLANEKHLYIQPHHEKPLLERMWALGEAVQKHLVTEIDYEKLKGGETVRRTIEPVGLMFSEYYFYLVAFIRDIDKKRPLKTRTICSPLSTGWTASGTSKSPGSTFRCPIWSAFRRASSASGCSSCTAADCRPSDSNTPAPPSRPCWTACPPQRSRNRPRTGGP